jgi:hypothetical protein
LLISGCQYDPWANGFVIKAAADRDLVGAYAVDADSQKRTIHFPRASSIFPVNAEARIVLSADHTVEFVRVPGVHPFTTPCSITGRGDWHTGKNGPYTVVYGNILNTEPDSPCKGDYGYELNLYGKKPPYKLNITIGDPDQGDAVQFERH